MKKNILVLLVSLLSVGSFAQKIKISKGEIKLDNKIVAYVEGKKPSFKIANLDKSYSLTVELKQVLPVPAIPIMLLKNEGTGKFNEIEFSFGKFNPFNNEKSVIAALVEHQYLSAEGLNTELTESFINGESTGVSAKLLGEQAKKDQINNAINAYKLTIDDAGTIYSIKAQNPDPNDKRIGYVKMTSPSNNGELQYEIFDLDNYLIATWFARGGTILGYNSFLNQELITADRRIFKVPFDNSGNPIGYKMSKDITAMNIVRALIGEGYTLQHQGMEIENRIKAQNLQQKQEQVKLNQEKYEADKLKSVNIYDKKGFVVNEKGEKTAGVFKIEFEQIASEKINGNNTFVPGQKLYQTDNKNIYLAKSGIRFCTEESKECFIGLTAKGGSILSSGIRALNGDNAVFYKILHEDNGLMVLASPNNLQELILKIQAQENGLFTTKVSNGKLKKNVSEYLKCDAVVFEKYDFKTLEGLIKVLEDYKSNCNK
ncbi:hypothetical protein B4N84_10710 [Flavobacterium sp. IR1]|nr:hypothetical protein B4N84_10710 [Flavobacterium sp. IR1]